MKTISIHDAKTNLSKYIAAAKKGQKIYIGGFGKAEVLLVKIPNNEMGKAKRNFSIGKHKISGGPEAFTESTDSIVSNMLAGS